MKRSEFKEKLHEYIKGVTFEGDLGTCEDILLIIEEAGMLPPLIKIEDTDIYGKPFTNFKNRWEKEDE